MQFYEFKDIEERAVLIGVQTSEDEDVAASLDELEELAETAGAETVAKVIQNREAVHPGTYIGKGKIEEVAALIQAYDANGVICDDELSPAQLNNLERELDCKEMDRTLLILDIFAARAVSSEGKIQVELAQLRYRAARLVGLRESLSRLGGGIGTRGPGEKKLEALNYYTNEIVSIPLDPVRTPQENAQRYFAKYNKQKRTFEALTVLCKETAEEISYLESVQTALDIALTENDLAEIKEELTNSGYIRRRYTKKKVKINNKPLHYISSDGFHIYVGKNNLQNDQLTFHFAVGNDWWFHAKQAPGSHVIVRTNGAELPDTTFEEAARLAAYYSSMRGSDKVEIDYVEKKQVKKPGGGKPGFVVYYTNYSMVIDSNISQIRLCAD